MFGIGSTELLVIILVALVVLGPKSLTGITRSLGKAVGEFRRVSTEFQRTLNAEVDQAAEEDRKKAAATTSPTETAQAQAPADAASAPAARQPAPDSRPGQPETRPQATATASRQDAPQNDGASMPAFDAVPQPPAPPADSPLAQALAKARAEAEAASNKKSTGGAA